MASYRINSAIVTQVLESDALLGQMLLFPEVVCVDAKDQRLAVNLRGAAVHLLGHVPAFMVHRRQTPRDAQVAELTVRLEPPPRNEREEFAVGSAWTDAVDLRFHIVRWQQSPDVQVAFVPALGIEVLAGKDEELDSLATRHIRAALRRTRAAASLRDIVRLQRTRELRLDPIAIETAITDPKQAAKDAEGRKEKPKPVIGEIGTELHAQTLPRAWEMDEAVALLADALTGRGARSVLLVGPSGVGKTAVVHELVRRRGDFQLTATPFWATSGARLIAGMSGFGMWQERCRRLVKEASHARAILHLGSLIELMEVGRSDYVGQGVAGFLRPAIARGELLAIAECTAEQLPVIERLDPHLLGAFHIIRIEEPSAGVGRMILLSAALAAGEGRAITRRESRERIQGSTREWVRGGHKNLIGEAALETLDRLHRRYATYSAFPGRPLRFLRNLLDDREHLWRREPWREHDPAMPPIGPADVTAAFARETGLPLFMLDDAVPLDLAAARESFAQRVVGQAAAVDLVTDLLATIKAGLNRPRRPIASLLFIGPTGVGKTEMAKALAAYFFGDAARVSRFDMSEYGSPAAVERLVGGVFGTEGLLTARIREQPFSVVLLDEFEKAHPAFFDLLLQVLGEGRLTDAAGRVADFSNAIVVMTSNLGADTYQQGGFGLTPRSGTAERNAAHAREHFLEAVREFLRPEMFNRIDRVVPFLPLDEPTILAITRRELSLLTQRDGVRLRGVELTVTEPAVRWLAERGYDVRYGARPLKRTIEREMLVPLGDALNQYPASMKLTATADVAAGEGSTARLLMSVRPASLSPTPKGDSTPAATARALSTIRRFLQALEKSAAVRSLRNELYMIERQQQRRQAKARGRKPADRAGKPAERKAEPHEDPARSARYRRLQHVAGAIDSLVARSVAAEETALLAVYSETPAAAPLPPATALAGERDELMLDLYGLRWEDPHRTTLGFFCEHVRGLFRAMELYFDIARALSVETSAWWFSRKPHSIKGELLRHEAPSAARLIAEPPHEAVGAVLELRGRYVMPLLEAEAGLHEFEDANNTTTVLLDVSETSGDRYEPPPGVEERGGIGGDTPRRRYDLSGATADDRTSGGKLRWHDSTLAVELQQQLRQRLKNAVAALVTP